MTPGVALHWALVAAAGGLVVGLVRVPLRLEERIAAAVVVGLIGSALASLGLALPLGLGAAAALLGPVAIAAGTLALAAALRVSPLRPWRESVAEARRRGRREMLPVGALALVAAAGFGILFAHTLYPDGGSIRAGFGTVWADWSLHATTASSFATGSNLPPDNPIFAGGPFLYPFLPDFDAAVAMALGAGVEPALAIPQAVLCVACTVLMASLARRLVGSVAAGVIAMAVCLLGGGLGFVGVYWDACHTAQGQPPSYTVDGTAARYTDDRCDPTRALRDPVGELGVFAGAVRATPGVVAAQPRAYDGLLTAPDAQPLGAQQQWYTPLLAWWLPQRSFVYGFALALVAAVLVLAGLRDSGRAWSPFAVAGLCCGLLPIVHVHSLIALAIVLALIAAFRRRREWLALLGITALVAAPRLLQLAAGGHGSAVTPDGPNTFPWLEPGWLANSGATGGGGGGVREFETVGVAPTVAYSLGTLVNPRFWSFWVLNCGLVLPLCLVMLAAWAGTRARWERLRGAAARVSGLVPPELLALVAACTAVFVAGNVVVFQAWDWDNTKLLVYWYTAGALLLGAVVVRLWRWGWWWRLASGAALATVLATGSVAVLRYLPWTPQTGPAANVPAHWATAADQQLARDVEARTARDAVVLTGGSPDDPLQTLAGRRTVLGYRGWLWSYGLDYQRRFDDVRTIYGGCARAGAAACPVPDLLRRYGISYVEVAGNEPAVDTGWWEAHYPALVRSGGTVVYDVRRS